MRSTAFVPVILFLLLPACTRTETVRPAPDVGVTSAPVPPARRSVYRLDFVLTTRDASAQAPTTFSYVVEDNRDAELVVGKNVPLQPWMALAVAGVPRADTGLKVHSRATTEGDSVLLEVRLEVSAAEPGSGPIAIRKFVSAGMVLLTPGKPSTVVTLDEAPKHYDLVVTATKVR